MQRFFCALQTIKSAWERPPRMRRALVCRTGIEPAFALFAQCLATVENNPLPYTFQSVGTSPMSAMPFGASGTTRLRRATPFYPARYCKGKMRTRSKAGSARSYCVERLNRATEHALRLSPCLRRTSTAFDCFAPLASRFLRHIFVKMTKQYPRIARKMSRKMPKRCRQRRGSHYSLTVFVMLSAGCLIITSF